MTDGPPAPAAAGLPPGDPRRRLIGRALLAALLVCAAFTVSARAAKEIRSLYVRSPWEYDPYDVVVSFTMFFVPLVAALGLARAALCRRDQPVPVRRLLDLLRAARVVLGAVTVTLAADWIAVAARGNRQAWNVTTGALVAGLALLTALTALTWLSVRRGYALAGAAAAVGGPGVGAAGRSEPDWLDDLGDAAAWLAVRLGPATGAAGRVARFLDRRLVPAVRRHPVGAAAAVAVCFGAAFAAAHSAAEGPGPLSVGAFFFGVSTCGMYAFAVITGAYLRISRSDRPARGLRRRLIDASVLASAAVPVALAFRADSMRIVGPLPPHGPHGQLARLTVLLLGAAAAAFALTVAAESAARTHPGQAR